MQYKVKELRIKLGMTQEGLAIKSGISRAIISKLESGDNVSTTTDTLISIAKALGCAVSKIFCP